MSPVRSRIRFERLLRQCNRTRRHAYRPKIAHALRPSDPGYRPPFDRMTGGFAFCVLMCDENGTPVDRDGEATAGDHDDGMGAE